MYTNERPAWRGPVAEDCVGSALLVVGVTRGGGGPLGALLRALPPRPGFAILVATEAEGDGRLAHGVLSGTGRPVVYAADGMPIRQDTIHVIPPAAIGSVDGGSIRVSPRADAHSHSVNQLFTSVADDHAGEAVGVLLGSSRTDGLGGLRRLRAAGAVTFAEARVSEDEGPDVVLPAREIASSIHRVVARRAALRATWTEDALRTLVSLLFHLTSSDFSGYDPAVVRRRAERRMCLEAVDRIETYLERLSWDRAEAEALREELLFRATPFFEDPRVLEHLRETVVPELLRQRARRTPLRVWVAGCGTGEEAWSIATTLYESTGDPRAFRVLGTDASERALGVARTGRYLSLIERDVSPDRLRRFFAPAGSGYRIRPVLRRVCVFARHDPATEGPFVRQDLICARTLLSPMSAPLRARTLAAFRSALRPDGRLLLAPEDPGPELARYFVPVDATCGLHEVRPDPPAPRRTASNRAPSFPPQPSPIRRAPRPARQPGRSGVLVVDDDRDAAESLALLLRLHGHEVRTAYDGPTALRISAEQSPSVVLMDLDLPGLDGCAVAEEIRRRTGPACPALVALTGHDSQEERARSAAAGFAVHLVKPCDADQLERLLEDPVGTAVP